MRKSRATQWGPFPNPAAHTAGLFASAKHLEITSAEVLKSAGVHLNLNSSLLKIYLKKLSLASDLSLKWINPFQFGDEGFLLLFTQ